MLYSFFFNDTATTEIYALSLHDALPISHLLPVLGDGRQAALFRGALEGEPAGCQLGRQQLRRPAPVRAAAALGADRKSTRLNSSHANISYAVFCLKKKHNQNSAPRPPSS